MSDGRPTVSARRPSPRPRSSPPPRSTANRRPPPRPPPPPTNRRRARRTARRPVRRRRGDRPLERPRDGDGDERGDRVVEAVDRVVRRAGDPDADATPARVDVRLGALDQFELIDERRGEPGRERGRVAGRAVERVLEELRQRESRGRQREAALLPPPGEHERGVEVLVGGDVVARELRDEQPGVAGAGNVHPLVREFEFADDRRHVVGQRPIDRLADPRGDEPLGREEVGEHAGEDAGSAERVEDRPRPGEERPAEEGERSDRAERDRGLSVPRPHRVAVGLAEPPVLGGEEFDPHGEFLRVRRVGRIAAPRVGRPVRLDAHASTSTSRRRTSS